MKKLPWILALSLPALGQDPDAEYKSRLDTLSKSLAAAHANVGDYLSGSLMHKWARDEYYKAMGFDPDNDKARKKLGFKKVDDKWENDPDAKQEFANKKTGGDEAKLRTEYDKKLTSLGKDFAPKFVELALWCEKAGKKQEAVENFKKAVEYDPTNEKSRKALGYEKQKNGSWLSAFEKALRKEMEEGLAKAPKGNPSSTQTDIERGMGLSFTKQESTHFLIESPHLDKAKLEDLIQHAEHTYAMWHKIFSQQNLFQDKKMNFVILKDQAQHISYVDKFDQSTGAKKDLAKKCMGSIGFPITECFDGDRGQLSLEDYVVHCIAQILQGNFAIGQGNATHNPLWVVEGTAYYFTRIMKKTAVCG